MANPFKTLSKYFRKPQAIPTKAVLTPSLLSDKEKDLLKNMGVYVQDLQALINQHTQVNFERHNLYREIDRCLAGDTKISLLNGTVATIREMAENPSKFMGLSVLSINPQTLKLEPDMIVGCKKTGVQQKVIRVHLDNEQYVDCTPEHRFMLRDGSYKEAKDLQAGDSLMPFYTKISAKGLPGYQMVYRPDIGKFSYMHRLVARFFNQQASKNGMLTHHKDFNPLNNDPVNLKVMSTIEHRRYHNSLKKGRKGYWEGKTAKTDKRLQQRSEHIRLKYKTGELQIWNKGLTKEVDIRLLRISMGLTGKKATEATRIKLRLAHLGKKHSAERCKKQSQAMIGRYLGKKHSEQSKQNFSNAMRERWRNPEQRATLLEHLDSARRVPRQKKVYLNHKVSYIEELTQLQDVYDIQTERNHNFPLAVGIFVHNSLVHPLMAGAAELYADVATNYSQLNNASVWITSDSETYKNKLEDMLEAINIEERIFDWAYSLAAYGDVFIKINATPGIGIVSISDDDHPLNISRVDKDGVLIGFYRTPMGMAGIGEARQLLPPWDYVHFRILGSKKKRPLYNDPSYAEYKSVTLLSPDVRRLTSKYGTSLLLNAIPTYKRLRLAEDSLLLGRLSKGIMRYIFKVKVDSATIEAVSEIIEDYKLMLKRTRAIDTSNASPNYVENFEVMDILTDLVIPVWGDVNNLSVEKLGGEMDVRWIKDIEELRNELATALRVPLPLLGGYTKELPGSLGRSAIDRLDIRFARSARRLQRALIEGIKRLCQIHLAYQGMSADFSMFEVNMSETSTAEEEELKDALDKGIDICDKTFDMITKALGEDIDRLELLDYLNQKILKLNDLDLYQLLKNKDSEMAKRLEARMREQKRLPKHIIKEGYLRNSDVRSFTPLEESRAQWQASYGNCTVKEELPEELK